MSTPRRILARLGAALLDECGKLSPAMQRNVTQRASTIGGPGDHAHVKERLAQFLREHGSDC